MDVCRHAVHMTLVREAVEHMPAFVVHRVSGVECGLKGEELHPATWGVVMPVRSGVRLVRMCDRHFALFILDREEFEQLEIPLEGETP